MNRKVDLRTFNFETALSLMKSGNYVSRIGRDINERFAYVGKKTPSGKKMEHPTIVVFRDNLFKTYWPSSKVAEFTVEDILAEDWYMSNDYCPKPNTEVTDVKSYPVHHPCKDPNEAREKYNEGLKGYMGVNNVR